MRATVLDPIPMASGGSTASLQNQNDLLILQQTIESGKKQGFGTEQHVGEIQRKQMEHELSIRIDGRKLLRMLGPVALRDGYDEAKLCDLLSISLLLEYWRYPVQGEEFRVTTGSTRAVLTTASAEQRQVLLRHATKWKQLTDQHEESLTRQETLRLENERVRRRFMSGELGLVYVRFQEIASKLDRVKAMIELKRSNPELTEDEVWSRAEQLARAFNETLESMKRFPAWVAPLEAIPEGLPPLNVRDREELKRRYGRTLRRAFLTVHIDLLVQDPAYSRLTPVQKDRLEALYQDVLRVSDSELAAPTWSFEYTHRALDFLERVIQEATAILQFAGLNVDAFFVPQGNTFEEQMAWFERQCSLIENDIESSRAAILALAEDSHVAEMRQMLALSPRRLEEVSKEIEKRTREYEKEAEKLQEELDRMFHGVASDA